MNVEVEGVKEAKKILEELAEIVQGPVTPDVLEKVGRATVDLAKSRTPVRTGYLRSRNQMEQTSRTEIRIFNDANYAGHVNFGTSKQMPQPFFSQAMEAAKRLFPELYVKEAKKKVDATVSSNRP